MLRQRLSAPRTLHAPHHLDVEVASTIRGLAAGKKITDRRGEQMLADYARLRITAIRLALPPPDVGTAAQPRCL